MNLENSELAKIFVGQLCSTLTCSVCKGKALTFDPYWELSVSLPKVNYHTDIMGSIPTQSKVSKVPQYNYTIKVNDQELFHCQLHICIVILCTLHVL